MKKSLISILILILAFGQFVAGCQSDSKATQQPIKNTITATQTDIPTATPTTTPTPTPSLPPTIQPTSTPIGPVGCLRPPDNYDLVEINGYTINQRTYQMLLHAQELYGGELQLTAYHLTQGSYTNLVSASFGTHNGGGAVDLSVIQYGTYKVLYDDIEPLILALRTAGFAAWLRDFDELYPGSPIHIHAIAIGDRDLSPAAESQLTGEEGYFRGFNGLPINDGRDPIPDEFGGPIICQWMIDLGYGDLRQP
ncbi:MAG: hypothetical protein CL609_20580 [Anaerolineaceae bacterium]|nr:hypothetical protein [Anaerolineaceae bacterium]